MFNERIERVLYGLSFIKKFNANGNDFNKCVPVDTPYFEYAGAGVLNGNFYVYHDDGRFWGSRLNSSGRVEYFLGFDDYSTSYGELLKILQNPQVFI